VLLLDQHAENARFQRRERAQGLDRLAVVG